MELLFIFLIFSILIKNFSKNLSLTGYLKSFYILKAFQQAELQTLGATLPLLRQQLINKMEVVLSANFSCTTLWKQHLITILRKGPKQTFQLDTKSTNLKLTIGDSERQIRENEIKIEELRTKLDKAKEDVLKAEEAQRECGEFFL